MARFAGLGFGLLLAVGGAGCSGITPAPTGPDPSTVQQCTAQSGFSARAAEARANGATGRFDATPEEFAAINACIRAKDAAGETGGSAIATSTPQPLSTAPAGGTDAFATQCLFEITVPVSAGRQAGIDAMNACIQQKLAAAGNAPVQTAALTPVAVALPSVAGVPQTVTSQTAGTSTTTTFTYGTPPASAAATSAASGPSPSRPCNLQMTGGTSYSCVNR